MTTDRKIDWLISSGSLVDVAVYPETCELIKQAYPMASIEARQRLVQAIDEAVATHGTGSDEVASIDRQLYDWFDVLLRADPECELAQTAFNELQSRHTDWEKQEHPDLLFQVSGAYHVSHKSPWTSDELLSRPGSAWVDAILGFEPPSWGELVDDDHMIEKRGAQGVREASTARASWGIEFAEGLIQRSEWRHDLWNALINAWQETEFTASEYLKVLEILKDEELIGAHDRSITHLLNSLVENGGKPFAVNVLPNAKQLALSIWDDSEDDRPSIGGPNDWLTLSLNSNAGTIVRFWLSATWVESQRGKNRTGNFRREDQEFFNRVVDDVGMRGKLAQAMLTSRLGYLLSFDHGWTTERLLPLFEPEHSSFVPAWHGFTWSQLGADVAELMKPKFLRAVENIEELGRVGVPERRSEFVRRYAKMMVYAVDKPLDKWTPSFFANSDGDDRYSFAWEIGRILENLADPQKVELWDRWLKQYWQNRLVGKPAPLKQKEIEEMIRWPRDLTVVFDQAVELTVAMQSTTFQHLGISRFIVDKDLAQRFPDGAAKLIDYLDKSETSPWDWYDTQPVFDALLQSDINAGLKEKIQDVQVRHANGVLG